MESKGSSIIVYYKENGKTYVLIGKESTWLEDKESAITNLQEYNKTTNFEDAEAHFNKTVIDLNTQYGKTYGHIKYDQIEKSEDKITVHYRLPK